MKKRVRKFTTTNRRLWKWTPLQMERLNWILDVLDELHEYKPLTVRQIFYQLVGKGFIRNNLSDYGNIVGKICKQGRLYGYISYKDIEDKTRADYDLTGWIDVDNFKDASLDCFLEGYRRDLMQTQNVFIEIWIEKDAISSIFIKIAKQYGIRVNVTQNNSTSNFFRYIERLKFHPNQTPIILFFSDFDPQGDNMLSATRQTLRDDFNIHNIEYRQVALKYNDIEKYNLYQNPDGFKKGDKLLPRFKQRYGDNVVPAELDALSPMIMENIIAEAIEAEIDMDKYQQEKQKQENDYIILKQLKEDVIRYISE